MTTLCCVQALLQWLNDSLEGRRIVVRDIVEDIYDGQILGELLCELPHLVGYLLGKWMDLL